MKPLPKVVIIAIILGALAYMAYMSASKAHAACVTMEMDFKQSKYFAHMNSSKLWVNEIRGKNGKSVTIGYITGSMVGYYSFFRNNCRVKLISVPLSTIRKSMGERRWIELHSTQT